MNTTRPERFGGDKPAADKGGPERYAPKTAPERLGDIDQAAANAFEGEIREFVRRDQANAGRRPRAEGEATHNEVVADNLNSLIRRVSGQSMEEIDRVITELQGVREMLRQEGERVTREVAGYASLNHAASTAMQVIGDSLKQWKGDQPRLPGQPGGQRSTG